MTINGMFDMLKRASYGVYAVDMNQTILFWNEGAERILEYKADQAVGRSCCEVMAGIAQDSSVPLCVEGCPSVQFANNGHVPSMLHVEVPSARGLRKPVTLTPLIVPENGADPRTLLLLFHETTDDTRAGRIISTVRHVLARRPSADSSRSRLNSADPTSLTVREVEIVQLLGSGLEPHEIAEEFGLSLHTVRNHIRNCRRKLGAKSVLDAVIAARRVGIL